MNAGMFALHLHSVYYPDYLYIELLNYKFSKTCISWFGVVLRRKNIVYQTKPDGFHLSLINLNKC